MMQKSKITRFEAQSLLSKPFEGDVCNVALTTNPITAELLSKAI
jgi:hypothetical protein